MIPLIFTLFVLVSVEHKISAIIGFVRGFFDTFNAAVSVLTRFNGACAFFHRNLTI
jgi:hypothetical protein